MDFTLDRYSYFLRCIVNAGFSFQTFAQYILRPESRVVILRHDVDRSPINSLKTAQIEEKLGITGTYYFRITKNSYDSEIIKRIAYLGHEIGYHYETMDTCRGKIDEAFLEFKKNLSTFRSIVPIETICMHGSPLSRFDNRDIWKKYDYKALGIIGEPYFDINFSKVLYLTDTGRCWNGGKMSIRDKEQKSENSLLSNSFYFHSTNDIIQAIIENRFPKQVMITVHPQRWTENILLWSKELVTQNLKNQVKKIIVAGHHKCL